MDDKKLRQTVSASGTAYANQCTLGAQTGPQTIIVRQIVGENEAQAVLDIHVVVPDQKPAIEQIIDVFVKNVEINSVDVITDKVIVRGDFELKAIYVACVPDQAVHAVELKNYKWTQYVDLPGAVRGMDADANVVVEFVDYDVSDNTRAYRYKYYGTVNDDDDDDDHCGANTTCTQGASDEGCTREFDVSVVLKVTAKVMTDREVQIGTGALPVTPKG